MRLDPGAEMVLKLLGFFEVIGGCTLSDPIFASTAQRPICKKDSDLVFTGGLHPGADGF